MPCYDFKCSECGHIEKDVLASSETTTQLCPKCSATMLRMLPNSTHTKVGASIDGKDPGRVTQEKNDQLKKKHSGYSHEQQSAREKITKHAQKALDKS